MNSRPKALNHFAIALLLLTIPLSAKADQPSAQNKTAPEDTFGRDIRDLIDVKDLDAPPTVISGRLPQYPRELGKAGPAGYVVVVFIINTSGDVIQTQVRESSRREFEMPALRAVQTWKFQPGKKGKRPANVRMTQRLEFDPPRK